VGHREGDFDFRRHLSQIFPYVTSILIYLRIGNPETTLLIHTQVVQKLEEHIKVRAGFHPYDALGSNINANLEDHPTREFLALFFSRLFPALAQVKQSPYSNLERDSAIAYDKSLYFGCQVKSQS